MHYAGQKYPGKYIHYMIPSVENAKKGNKTSIAVICRAQHQRRLKGGFSRSVSLFCGYIGVFKYS